MTQDFAARLQRLEDIEEIKALIAQYAWHVPRCEIDQLVALFTQDGEFRGGEHVLKGRERVRAHFAVLTPNSTVPLVQNILVKVNGDTATATCKMSSRWLGPGPGFVGWYEDEFRRVDGKWFFSSRWWRFHEQPVA
jgi:hypothetical protein